MIKKLLITKHTSDAGVLKNYCTENNIICFYHSFLTFESVPIHKEIEADVLFFSSKRGVHYFLESNTIQTNQEIACIGQATQFELEKRGFKVSFTSTSSGNPEIVSSELRDWLGKKSIAILSALSSYATISVFLNPAQTTFIPCYKSILSSEKIIDKFDVFVFTSPSNVKAFLTHNTLSANATVIACGNTTASYLLNQNIQPKHVLSTASESELIEYLERNSTN